MVWVLVILAAAPVVAEMERVIDPPDTAIPYSEPLPQLTPRIAAQPVGGGFLMVWADFREREGVAIYGTPISLPNADAVIDQPHGVEISPPQPGAFYAPAVAAFEGGVSQRGYLVVWEMAFVTTQIWGRRVGPGGALTSGAFPIGDGSAPTVACMGVSCLVAWTGVDGTVSYRVYGNIAAGLTAPMGGAVRPIPERGLTVAVSAAPDLRSWAMVWNSDPADAGVGVLRLAYVGEDAGRTAVQTVGSGVPTDDHPAISHSIDDGGFGGTVIAFPVAMLGSRPLYAAMHTPAGVVRSPTALVATGIAGQPAIAWDGAQFILTWVDVPMVTPPPSATLRRMRFGYLLLPSIDTTPTVPAGTFEVEPSVAVQRKAGNFVHSLVAFRQTRGGFALHDAVLQQLTTGAAVATKTVTVSRAMNAQASPAVLRDGSKFIVAWVDCRRATPDPPSSLYLAGYDNSGTEIDDPSVVSDTSFAPSQPALAAVGDQQLLAWMDHGEGRGVQAMRLRGPAAVDGTLISLSSGVAVDFETTPSIASSGPEALVAWAGQGTVWFRRVAASGAVPDVSGPVRLGAFNGGSEYPSAAWDGQRYLVVWNTRRSLDGSSRSRLASAVVTISGGAPLVGPGPMNTSGQLYHQARPTLVSNGAGKTLVVWTQGNGPAAEPLGYDVVAALVDANQGGPAVAFLVANAASSPERQRLAAVFDGTNYLVAYLLSTGRLDVATISPAGTLLHAGSTFDGMGLRPRGRNPALGVGASGDGLFFYDDFRRAEATMRTFYRTFKIVPDAGQSDGGADAGLPTPDGGSGLVVEIPELKGICTQPIEGRFTANLNGVTWELVEGQGRLSNDGLYHFDSVPPKQTFTVKVLATTPRGDTATVVATVVVDCPPKAQLGFKTSTCGCGAGAFGPLALLALLLFCRRRGGLALLGLTLSLGACGRTAFYDSRDSMPAPPPPAPASFCGDSEVNTGEQCDDGDTDGLDECLPDCMLARCGDGLIRTGVEACDDGNTDENDACTSRCSLTSCGNGRVDPGEECDDSNTDETDACQSTCLAARCGDGHVFLGMEPCDDGNSSNTDACTNACRLPRCGDGFAQAGVEKCDDGNPVDDDFCTNGCALPVCGDGRKAGAEECDLGAMNGDRPAFLISQMSGTSIATDALVRGKTAVVFYDYRSASSHTGLEQVGESRIYLYADSNTGRLSLVLTHGIDFDSSGQRQPASTVNMDITGLPNGVMLDVVDDPGLSPAEATKTGSTATGRWNFNQNSDGMVLGGLPFPGVWKVTVTPQFTAGITTWGWVKHDAVRIPLTLNQSITIESFDTATFCGTDCKVPRCGDGKFQGGEVCDDGNTVGGDGCSADCKSLR